MLKIVPDNKSESFNNESVTLAPGIWMAIYDPTLDIAEALSSGEVYTAQIDANSHTVVNIGLVYYKYISRRPVYKYGKLRGRLSMEQN